MLEKIKSLFDSGSKFRARQLMFNELPMSYIVENYLVDDKGDLQSLDGLPMLREVYDTMPDKLLLKCSRKVTKSTLVSNVIAIDMIRWNYYRFLYITPSEKQTKSFSSAYITPRFDSPRIKKILNLGLEKNDVFEKILGDSKSSVVLNYVCDDADRIRGLSSSHNIMDEVQSIAHDTLLIIDETMAMDRYKRKITAGTPLTTDNTINRLWEKSTMNLYATKCSGCNTWNTLTPENNPISMVRPEGYCCYKCSKILDSGMTGKNEWVVSGDPKALTVGYHLAQPMLPHHNQVPKMWKDVYEKVRKVETGEVELYAVYNEVFGLAYDVGAKPITLEELKDICTLGPMKDDNGELQIYDKHKSDYRITAYGQDYGVNAVTSRTATCGAGLRHDGKIEVFFSKIFKTTEYNQHLRETAILINKHQSFGLCDSGPDPIRGQMLAEMTSPKKVQLASYQRIKRVWQTYYDPAGRWQDNRLVLHKSDCFSTMFRLLKHKQILFPQYSDMQEAIDDILNVFIEVKEVSFNQQLFYTHKDDHPDDWLHAMCYSVMCLLIAARDPRINGPSSSSNEVDSD